MSAADRIRKELLKRIRRSHARMTEQLERDAPDYMLAHECRIMADLGAMLVPSGAAVQLVTELDIRARKLVGLCSMAGCENDAEHGARECADHMSWFAAERAAIVSSEEEPS